MGRSSLKGHIRQRGENSWSLSIYKGRDATGKSRYAYFTVRGLRKDAERELRRLLREMDTGGTIDPTKITTGEYLERWLSDYAAITVAKTTLKRYRGIVRSHLLPHLGKILLTKLRPLDIQKAYASWLRDGRKDGKPGGLSAQTVLHHHRVLKEALEQAVKWQLIGRNPADAVEPPTPSKAEMQALNEGQVGVLLGMVKGTPLYMPTLLAVTMGMRRGEVLGLKWSDVDFERGVISVRRSLGETEDGLEFGETKTKRSTRSIRLLEITSEELRRHKVSQAKERLLWGKDYDNNDLVCCEPNGRPIIPGHVSHNFAHLMKAQKQIPRIRFHDLRHTHATLLLKQGVHPKIVSERLGHSTISQTLDTYSHVLPDMQDEAVQKLDRLLKGG